MFVDRREAGERLAEALLGFASEDPVVLGLPRGGVPVAAEVASALHAPLDVLVVRKLGCPWQPELGFGAIGEGGVRVVNAPLIEMLNISQEQLDQIVAREESEVARRVHRYRGDRPPVGIEGRTMRNHESLAPITTPGGRRSGQQLHSCDNPLPPGCEIHPAKVAPACRPSSIPQNVGIQSHAFPRSITTSDTTGDDGPTRPSLRRRPTSWGTSSSGKHTGRFGLSTHSPQLRPCRY